MKANERVSAVISGMFTFKHPFTCVVSGPTQSGKTEFLLKLVRRATDVIVPPPERIIWCYGEYDPVVPGTLPPGATTHRGIYEEEELQAKTRNLLILDDLMSEASNNKYVEDLFTRGSHHRNTSVVLTVHNLFHQGKVMRTVSLNTHYFVLFKNPRDAGQIRYLGNQMFPGKLGGSRFLADAYRQATVHPHSYLLVDATQATPEDFRVLSDIFPDEETYCYHPKP